MHESESKFVEWTMAINEDDYDVKAAIDILCAQKKSRLRGLDVGGGIGRFASILSRKVPNCEILVVDKSSLVTGAFVKSERCRLVCESWFDFEVEEKFDFIILKTVLHHFVGNSEKKTRDLQLEGLKKAAHYLVPDGVVIVEENFYESYLGRDLCGRLIFEITKLKFIAPITRRLGANTAGEGVRFRSMDSWIGLFTEAGLSARQVSVQPWGWHRLQRLVLLGRRRYQAVLALCRNETA